MRNHFVTIVTLLPHYEAMRTSSDADLDKDGIWETTCSEQHPRYGEMDRWVKVSPKTLVSEQVMATFSVEEWSKWMSPGTDVKDGLSFRPFILRGREQWLKRPIAQVKSTLLSDTTQKTDAGVECVDEWSTGCKEDIGNGVMTFNKMGSCTGESEMVLGGMSSMYKTLCSQTVSNSSSFASAFIGEQQLWDQRVSVHLPRPGDSGTDEALLELPSGQCVVLTPFSAANGIELEPLDGDLMGTGLQEFSKNTSKMETVLGALTSHANSYVDSVVATGDIVSGGVQEGYADIAETGAELGQDLRAGSVTALNKTLKWVRRAVLESRVEACLCCDMPAVPITESMADHCMVAYTMGGTNSSQPYNFYSRVTAGTAYKLSQEMGSYFLPFVGGHGVKQANRFACQYACDSRVPDKYEEYAHGTIRVIPGVALKTWYLTPVAARLWTGPAAGATAAVAAIEDAIDG